LVVFFVRTCLFFVGFMVAFFATNAALKEISRR